VPCALGAAVSYGASTAVQHAEAHTGTGRADTRGLLRLLRQPRWLVGFAGDGVGLALQVIALATGPVALVQPLLVLAVPVSLPLSHALGGRAPRRGDYLACLGILAGLGLFFAMLGDPGLGNGTTVDAVVVASVAALGAGTVLSLAVAGRGTAVRAGTYGAIAGGGFGLAAVLLGAAGASWRADGTAGLTGGAGLAALLAAALVGAAAITLTQIAFQVGPLAASFPANEAAAPVVAVILGAVLLNERVPFSGAHIVVYLICLAVVVGCTARLAAP
jgi:drug/metabolite transporter (DMT)-like permease